MVEEGYMVFRYLTFDYRVHVNFPYALATEMLLTLFAHSKSGKIRTGNILHRELRKLRLRYIYFQCMLCIPAEEFHSMKTAA